jgi:hypothetical protein
VYVLIAAGGAPAPPTIFGVGQSSYLDIRSHPYLWNAGNIGPLITGNFQSYGTLSQELWKSDWPSQGIGPNITNNCAFVGGVHRMGPTISGVGDQRHICPLFYSSTKLPLWKHFSRNYLYVAEKDPLSRYS